MLDTKDRAEITLRDYFAGQALGGLLVAQAPKLPMLSLLAQRAYEMADALLIERNKPTPTPEGR